MLSAAVHVPEADQRNGAAATYPPLGPAGKALRVRRAAARPEHAYVAVKHRDEWFYIDDTDQATKRFFRLLSVLWSVTITERTAKEASAPVLTAPVTR